jgi:hypothetical protein
MEITNITGPIGLYHYFSDDYGMDIYLFADHHALTADCKNKHSIHISDFIVDLIKEKEDRTIDLFLESAALIEGKLEQTPNLHSGRSYIQNVVLEVENCLVPLKSRNREEERETVKKGGNGLRQRKKISSCEYPNVLIHPFDFRWDSDIKIWEYFISLYRGKQLLDSHKEVYRHVRDILERLEDILSEGTPIGTVTLLVSLYDIDELIEEQYKHVNRVIRKKIIDYIEETVASIVPGGVEVLLEGLKRFVDEIKKKDSSKLSEKEMKRLSNYLVPYIEAETWVVDYYSLARMFSVYGEEKRRPDQILYYAGFYHVDSTRGLLRSLGFEQIEKTESKHQCLDISHFSPFLSLLNDNRCMKIRDNGFRCRNIAVDGTLCSKHC